MQPAHEKVIGILVSDLHFRHTCPPARAAEPDWYAAMKRYIDQLGELAATHDAPIFAAGDVFDKWNSPPELINFLLRHLPTMWAIPGQHDLPHHDIQEKHRSAYGTLVEAGRLAELPAEGWYVGGVWAVPFPWGRDPEPFKITNDASVYAPVILAIVHKYIWTSASTSHPGADPGKLAGSYAQALTGYTAAVFGDNHKPFVTRVGGCNIINTGGFMATKSDERNMAPGCGLLYADGRVARHLWDTSEDHWVQDVEEAAIEEAAHSNLEFLQGLQALGQGDFDYRVALRQHLEAHPLANARAQQIILDAVDAD